MKTTTPPTVPRPRLAKGRPSAPAGLPDAAVDHWNAIVSSLDADYFVASDLPLLASYARALASHDHARSTLEERGYVDEKGKTSGWVTVLEKETRACVALSARLRLAPQSRMDRTKAGKAGRSVNGTEGWDDDDDGLLARSEDRFFQRAAR